MKQELITTGKTVEAAVAAAADSFGVDISKVEYEVIETPKKGFLGFGETPAKVRAVYTLSPEESALAFVNKLLTDMELDATAALSDPGEDRRERSIAINGGDAGILIGHHGDTLDSLQYLVNLAANKREEDDDKNYTRITVDIENYRAKREETLRTLARRMAAKVIKYGKSITLEPMSPYERRIIHSEVQGISGVTTVSIGVENNRRVVISLEGAAPFRSQSSYRSQPDRRSQSPRKPRYAKPASAFDSGTGSDNNNVDNNDNDNTGSGDYSDSDSDTDE